MGPLHIIVTIFFQALVILMFIWMIISWIPVGRENPIIRFFDNIGGPLIEPIVKRLPRISFMMFDATTTIAFVIVWWALQMLNVVILAALPASW